MKSRIIITTVLLFVIGLCAADRTLNVRSSANARRLLVTNAGPSDITDGLLVWWKLNDGSGTLAISTPSIGDYGEYAYGINGKIDDARYYNRALSDAEILQLYNNGPK